MKLFKWIYGVTTGRIRHWNDNNNQLVADLWAEIESLNEPTQTALKGAIVSSLQVVERMMGPNVGRNGWMRVDLLEIKRDTLFQIYSILIDIFLALNGNIFPDLLPQFSQVKMSLFGKQEIAPNVTSLLQNNRTDIEGVANAAWEEITKIINPEIESNVSARYAFLTFMVASAKENAKQMQDAHSNQ